MARIAGVELPKNKVLKIALTYIYGIGPFFADEILKTSKVDPQKRVKELTEKEILALRDLVRAKVIEGDLRRQINQNIRRLIDIGSRRGFRHKRKLPVRGQRTHTNARTRRGKKIAVAGKKKVTK